MLKCIYNLFRLKTPTPPNESPLSRPSRRQLMEKKAEPVQRGVTGTPESNMAALSFQWSCSLGACPEKDVDFHIDVDNRACAVRSHSPTCRYRCVIFHCASVTHIAFSQSAQCLEDLANQNSHSLQDFCLFVCFLIWFAVVP